MAIYGNHYLIAICALLLTVPLSIVGCETGQNMEREALLPQETRDLIALDRPGKAREMAERERTGQAAGLTPQQQKRLELLNNAAAAEGTEELEHWLKHEQLIR